MARLPQPGGDSGTWGNVLNDYLSQTLKPDGTLKDDIVTSNVLAPNSVSSQAIANDAVTAASIVDGSITEVLLSSDVQTKLNTAASGSVADGTITTAKLHDDAVTDAKVAPGAAIAQSKIANLTTDLAGKASSSHTHTASNIADSTPTGRALLTAADAAAARTAIGAGTSSLAIGTTSATAKAGDYTPTKADVGLGNVDNTSDAAKNTATVTLTNKTISGASNTLTAIPQSAVTNLVSDLSSKSGPLTPTTVKSGAYTAVVGDLIPVDAASGAVAITLPTTPADKSQIQIKKIDSSANAVAITAGGSDVFNTTGGPTSVMLQLTNQVVTLQYSSSTGVWYVTSTDTPVSGLDGRYQRQATDVVNVKDYGAKGDNSTDDTAAIEAAWAVRGEIYFPPGVYRYNGTGLTRPASYTPTVHGSSVSNAMVVLGTTSYLFNFTDAYYSMDVQDIEVRAGLGAFKSSHTGSHVGGHSTWTNVRFKNYTECAWAADASDMPYLNFVNCVFDSANMTSTIGVALSGLADQCSFINCSFYQNRISVKLREGGNNCHFYNCDFLRWTTTNSGGPRVDIWVVPDPDGINAGEGFGVEHCKFGPENLVAGDYRIVYADELSGSRNGTRMPNFGTDSTGYITGHNITDCFFGFYGFAMPIVYSTAKNVLGCEYKNLTFGGAVPSYILEFRTVTTVPDMHYIQNIFGPFTGKNQATYGMGPLISNVAGVGYSNDQGQILQTRANHIRGNGSGSAASFSELISIGARSASVLGATLSDVADAFGGTDATKITYSAASGQYFYAALSAMTPGKPVWVEVDIKNPNDGSALAQIWMYIKNSTGDTGTHWRRAIEVPSVAMGWVTYAFSFTPRSTSAPYVWITNEATASTGTVTVGRIRIYHSNERVLGGRRPSVAAAATDAATTQSLVNDLRTKLISLGLVQ